MCRALFDEEFVEFLINRAFFVLGNLYSLHFNKKYWDLSQDFLSKDETTLVKKAEALVPF